MKKFKGILLVSVLLLSALLPCVLPAAAEVDVETFTAEVFLSGMKEDRYNTYVLTLELPPENGEEKGFYAEVYTEVNCPFYDSRNDRVSPNEFLLKYQGKQVSVDFVELAPETYMVIECRAGD